MQAEDNLKEVQKSVAEKEPQNGLRLSRPRSTRYRGGVKKVINQNYCHHQTFGVKAGLVSTFSIWDKELDALC